MLEGMSGALGGQLESLQRDAHALVGREFNLDSPKQLAEILFDDSTHLVRRIQDAGGDASLEKWDRMIHVFQAFPQLDEAHQAVRRIGQFVRGAVGAGSP